MIVRILIDKMKTSDPQKDQEEIVLDLPIEDMKTIVLQLGPDEDRISIAGVKMKSASNVSPAYDINGNQIGYQKWMEK